MIMRDVGQKAVSFYDHRVVSISTPEQSLVYLEKIMKSPGDSLVLKSQKFRLNWMGVRVDDVPDSEGNEISLAEFLVREEFRRSALLVTFSLGTDAEQ